MQKGTRSIARDEPTQAVFPVPSPPPSRLELEDSLCHLENVLGAPQCDLHHTSAFYSHSFPQDLQCTQRGDIVKLPWFNYWLQV